MRRNKVKAESILGQKSDPVLATTKQEQFGNKRSTISVHRNPNYVSIQPSAKSNKNVVQQKGQSITYILTRPCMIPFRLFRSENAFLSLHAR